MSIKYPTQGELDWQSLISSALTAEITINPLPFQVAMKRAVAHYNQHNSNHIRAGLKQTMEVGTPRALNATALWIRHNQTNYDQIWPRFAVGDDQNAQPWQIIFRRTMRLIEQTYPELITQVHSAVTHRLPLDIREPICFPGSMDDMVAEVRENVLKFKNNYTPSIVSWRELLRNHILHTRTDYPLLVSAYKHLPDEERKAKSSQVRRETMPMIDIAFPELKGDIRPYIKEKAVHSSVPAEPVLPASPTPEQPAQEQPAPVSSEPADFFHDSGFRLEVMPLDKLLTATARTYNKTVKDTAPHLDLNGNAAMQSEIRLRSINHLLVAHSNRAVLMKPLATMTEGEAKTFMVRAVEYASHQAICQAYPELASESEAELNRRLSGKKFQKSKNMTPAIPKPPITPSLDMPGVVDITALTFDELLRLTVENVVTGKKKPLVLGGTSRQTAVVFLHALRFAVQNLKALDSDLSDGEALDRIGTLYPALAHTVGKERLMLETKVRLAELEEAGELPGPEHLRVAVMPLDTIKSEAVERYNERVIAGTEAWTATASLIDVNGSDPAVEDEVMDLCVGAIIDECTNYPFLSPHLAQPARQELKRAMYESVRKAYPELGAAVDRAIAVRCAETTPLPV